MSRTRRGPGASGETILVTDRDEVVAELRPVGRQRGPGDTLDEILDALAEGGEITRASTRKGAWGLGGPGARPARGPGPGSPFLVTSRLGLVDSSRG